MGNTNNRSAVADAEINADITAAAIAGENVRQSGGGDIAEYAARRSELEAIRDRAIALATIDRDGARAKAALWGGTRGAKMIDNAQSDFSAASKAAHDRFFDELDGFAVTRNMLHLLDGNKAAEILARRAQAVIDSLVQILKSAQTAGLETLATRNGRTYVVSELMALYGNVNAITATATAVTTAK